GTENVASARRLAYDRPAVPDANQSAERRWGGWSSWLARRRVRIALGLLALAVVVRVALPPVLRRVIVSQANAALAGRLEVGDVDLWLVLGGAALKDVALRAENAAPTAPPRTSIDCRTVPSSCPPCARARPNRRRSRPRPRSRGTSSSTGPRCATGISGCATTWSSPRSPSSWCSPPSS